MRQRDPAADLSRSHRIRHFAITCGARHVVNLATALSEIFRWIKAGQSLFGELQNQQCVYESGRHKVRIAAPCERSQSVFGEVRQSGCNRPDKLHVRRIGGGNGSCGESGARALTLPYEERPVSEPIAVPDSTHGIENAITLGFRGEIGMTARCTKTLVIRCYHGEASLDPGTEILDVALRAPGKRRGAFVGRADCAVRPGYDRPAAGGRIPLWPEQRP